MFDPKTIFTGKPAFWISGLGVPPAYEYTTFGRRFLSYRWFKPLLTAALAIVFWIVIGIIVLFAATAISQDPDFISTLSGEYEDMDSYSAAGCLANFGILAAIIPAIMLALLVTEERPFSSLSSSCGGWRWPAFWKCLGVAGAFYVIEIIVQLIIFPGDFTTGEILFSASGLVICIALVPFQCMAEEYLFRGFLMQTFGSWFRFPLIALLLQSVLFAAGHPYNTVGMIAIFIDGIAFGLVTMVTKGLESSGAFHIVNNMVAFLMLGFGLVAPTSVVTVEEAVLALIVDVAYAAIMIVADRKWHWFEPKVDGTITYNEKCASRMFTDNVDKAVARGAILPPSYIAWRYQQGIPFKM